MKQIYIYTSYFDSVGLIFYKSGRIYKILKEKPDAYFIENLNNSKDQQLIFKTSKIFNIENVEWEQAYNVDEFTKTFIAAFIFDSEDKNFEEKKIKLMQKADKLIELNIKQINNKIKKMNEVFNSSI